MPPHREASVGTPTKQKFNQAIFSGVLGASKEQFEAIKNDVRNMLEEFDLTMKLSDQTGPLTQLKEKILTKYPDVFGNDTTRKLRLVCVYASKRYGNMRHSAIKGSGKTGDARLIKIESPRSVIIPEPPQDTPCHCDKTMGQEAEPENQLDTEQGPHSSEGGPMFAGPSTNQAVNQTQSPASSSSQHTCDQIQIIEDVDNQPSSHRNPDPDPPTFPSPPPTEVPPQRTRRSLLDRYSGSLHLEVEGMRYFLRGCTPSMEYFLPRFVDYGCHSLNLLRAAKNWPESVIDAFLHDLPTRGGRAMTPMEILILRMHLIGFSFDKPEVERSLAPML